MQENGKTTPGPFDIFREPYRQEKQSYRKMETNKVPLRTSGFTYASKVVIAILFVAFACVMVWWVLLPRGWSFFRKRKLETGSQELYNVSEPSANDPNTVVIEHILPPAPEVEMTHEEDRDIEDIIDFGVLPSLDSNNRQQPYQEQVERSLAGIELVQQSTKVPDTEEFEQKDQEDEIGEEQQNSFQMKGFGRLDPTRVWVFGKIIVSDFVKVSGWSRARLKQAEDQARQALKDYIDDSDNNVLITPVGLNPNLNLQINSRQVLGNLAFGVSNIEKRTMREHGWWFLDNGKLISYTSIEPIDMDIIQTRDQDLAKIPLKYKVGSRSFAGEMTMTKVPDSLSGNVDVNISLQEE